MQSVEIKIGPITTNLDLVERVYARKGVAVDLAESQKPLFMSGKERYNFLPQVPIKFAIKRNIPGYWDPSSPEVGEQIFLNEPTFKEHPDQPLHQRHSLDVFTNERVQLQRVNDHPVLRKYVPLLFHGNPNMVITEFVPGELLENLIEDNNFSNSNRLKIILQLGEFLNTIHGISLHHNDLHDKNIIVTNGNLCVIDYSMAGDKKDQAEKWWDVNQYNKTIARLVTRSQKENIRKINDNELPAHTDILFKDFISRVPFSEHSLYETWIELGTKLKSLLI